MVALSFYTGVYFATCQWEKLRQKHDDVHASPAGVSTVENSKKNVQTTKYRKNIDNVVGKAGVKADAVSDTIQNSFF